MFKYLINLVEIRTKVTSIFPFFYVLIIYLYCFNEYNFNLVVAILFFISMLCLDMATTVLNHLAGIYIEDDMSKHDEELISAMAKLGITSKFNNRLLVSLITVGTVLGLYIALTTSWLIIIIGLISLIIAVLYSFGPLPIKDSPLGEVASGLAQGMLIPFAFLLSQDSSLFITTFDYKQLVINVPNTVIWVLILIVPTVLIANIMLANNLSDCAKDKNNGRITLPIVIGPQLSKILWTSLYAVAYLIIIILICLGVLPKLTTVFLLSVILVYLNGKKFVSNPVKHLTFKYSVINLQLVLLTVIIPTMVMVIIN